MNQSIIFSAMKDPGFYPGRPQAVEVVQTHISYIFIAGDDVYKVKKAVDFGFLDFTDLAKRKYFCEEEVRLNRRLAPHTYLGVVELFENADGSISVGQGDRVVEYAVWMRRLPQDRMLKKLIGAADFDPAVMDAIARKVADFHAQAATGHGIDEMGGLETIRRNHDENFQQTQKYIGVTITETQYSSIGRYVHRFLEEKETLLEERVRDHHIRDCHGDLHLEHIVVGEEITIFDCIEFNERFRYADAAAEVAFLAMDLDYNGYSALADRFVHAYTQYAGDTGIPVLLNFYRCYYAYVRGKVVSFRLDDPAISPEDRDAARQMAARYFDLAYTYAARLERPTLLLMTGLMGTGKSVLARLIAPRLGARIIQNDVLRKELLGIAPAERHYEAFGQGIYSADMSARTYEEARRQASEALRAGQSVIIDASYKRWEERERALETARQIGADYLVIECVCPDDIVRTRLDSRMSTQAEASDGRWDLYLAQKADFDPITEVGPERHLSIDTSATPESCAEAIVEGRGYQS